MSVAGEHPKFDSAKAEAFAGQFLTALNRGSLCLMATYNIDSSGEKASPVGNSPQSSSIRGSWPVN